jgi:hypothetical protein
MRTDLQRLKRDSESGHLAAVSSGAVAEASAVRTDKLWKIAVPVLLVALLVVGGLYYWSHRESRRLTDKDTIVLAAFANSKGDSIFDDTLRRRSAFPSGNRRPQFALRQQVAKTLQQMTRPASTKLTSK